MKVKIEVEFEVTTDEQPLEERIAKAAAEQAVFNNLCLSKTGESMVDDVMQHVDGFGECIVRLVE